MKTVIRSTAIFFLLITGVYSSAKSQVLISLLLGDKLNSPNLEFGLEGGANYSSFYNLDDQSRKSNFNLGFYFLFRINGKSWINTGVLVKQNQGADNLATYSIGDPQVDSLFADGTLSRQINYFQVPATWHYRLHTTFYLEAGFQVALRNGGKDIFYETVVEDDDATFTITTKSDYTTLDGGLLGGLGYKFKPKKSGAPGMSIGAKYYYGLVDVLRDENSELYNDSFYWYVRIPIGAGKAAAKAEE